MFELFTHFFLILEHYLRVGRKFAPPRREIRRGFRGGEEPRRRRRSWFSANGGANPRRRRAAAKIAAAAAKGPSRDIFFKKMLKKH